MNALRSIGIALFVHLLGGCPGTTETDAGLDAALADAPLDVRVVDDITHIDAPLGDVSTSDAPSDAGSSDAGSFDGGECLAAGTDCSTSEGLACCGPATCVPTGGAGLYQCVDETGCIPLFGACGPSDRCCGGNACGGGMCLPAP